MVLKITTGARRWKDQGHQQNIPAILGQKGVISEFESPFYSMFREIMNRMYAGWHKKQGLFLRMKTVYTLKYTRLSL